MLKEAKYRIYVTDSLYFQAEDKRLNVRYYDILFPPKIDNRSGDEIAMDVISSMNLKVM